MNNTSYFVLGLINTMNISLSSQNSFYVERLEMESIILNLHHVLKYRNVDSETG